MSKKGGILGSSKKTSSSSSSGSSSSLPVATSDVDIVTAKKLGLFDDSELAAMMGESTDGSVAAAAAAKAVEAGSPTLKIEDSWQELEGEVLKLRGSTPLPSSPSLEKKAGDVQGSSSFSNFFRVGPSITFDKHYLIMQSIQLALYKSREDAHKPGNNPSKLIPLERAEKINPVTINDSQSKEHSNSFPFEFTVGKKVLSFTVPTERERSVWLEALRRGSVAAKKSGSVDLELTDEQAVLFEKMKVYLPQTAPILNQDEITLIRFLRSRDFDLATSVGSFKESFRFRKFNNVNNLTIADVYHEAKRGLAYFLGSQDRKGHKVQVLKAGAYSRLDKVCPRQAMKYLVYLRQKEVWEKGQKDILLVDLNGININQIIMFVNRTYYYLMDYIFPSTTGMVIMFNTPWWIRAAWSVAKGLVDPAQRNSVLFLGTNLELLKELVGEESLPKEYGGSFTGYNHEEWIKDRFRQENLKQEDAPASYSEDPLFMIDVFPDYDDVTLDVTVAGTSKGCWKAGWLTKLGGNVHNWRKRYFVLKGHTVYYYKDEKASKPQGSVHLESDCKINPAEDPGKKATPLSSTTFLELVTPRRTYVFKATSVEERDEWVKVLQAHTPSS